MIVLSSSGFRKDDVNE